MQAPHSCTASRGRPFVDAGKFAPGALPRPALGARVAPDPPNRIRPVRPGWPRNRAASRFATGAWGAQAPGRPRPAAESCAEWRPAGQLREAPGRRLTTRNGLGWKAAPTWAKSGEGDRRKRPGESPQNDDGPPPGRRPTRVQRPVGEVPRAAVRPRPAGRPERAREAAAPGPPPSARARSGSWPDPRAPPAPACGAAHARS